MATHSVPNVGLPRDVLAPHAVARWAAEAPDSVATQDVVSGARRTYAELDAEAHLWAGAFRAVGIGAESHVASLIPNIPEAHATWLGLAWLRAREVPMNTALVGTLLHDALARSDT